MPSAAAKVIDPNRRKSLSSTSPGRKPENNVDAALLKIATASKTSPLKIMRDLSAWPSGRARFLSRTITGCDCSTPRSGRGRIAGRSPGSNAARPYYNINYRYDWWGLVENKIASDTYLAAYGFPTIPVVALYQENLNTGGASVARDERQLRDLLTDEANYPMFGKPTEGQQSLGSIGLYRYRPREKSLETQDIALVPLDEFVEQVRSHYANGYLFQKLVSPHADIRALCGDRLATVRIVTLAE